MAEQDEHGTTVRSVEDAPGWGALEQTLAEARIGFADLRPEAVEDLVDEAMTAVRRSHKPLAPKASR